MQITGQASATFSQCGKSYPLGLPKCLDIREPLHLIFFITGPVKSFLAHNLALIIALHQKLGPPLYLTAICTVRKAATLCNIKHPKSTQQLFIFARKVCYSNDVMEKSLESIRKYQTGRPFNPLKQCTFTCCAVCPCSTSQKKNGLQNTTEIQQFTHGFQVFILTKLCLLLMEACIHVQLIFKLLGALFSTICHEI